MPPTVLPLLVIAWCLVSIPAALLLGRLLASGSVEDLDMAPFEAAFAAADPTSPQVTVVVPTSPQVTVVVPVAPAATLATVTAPTAGGAAL